MWRDREPPELYERDPAIYLSLSEPRCSRELFPAPRVRDSNKGLYGHVLVIAAGAEKEARQRWRESQRCARERDW